VRIVYTNLKENDAGVERSVRQFRVEFNGTGALSPAEASSAKPVAPEPSERSEADRRRGAQSPEAANAFPRQQITPPPAGMASLRSIFIKKFINAQTATAVVARKKENLSITV
jgi:hypothetical protein